MRVILPEEFIEESFLAATGPGGQNVNKVATACQLRVDVYALRLHAYAFRRLKELAGSKMTLSGELIVTARSHRTREANRADARARVQDLLDKAHIRAVKRIATRPGKAAKTKRLEVKKGRGQVKKNRSKPNLEG
jgi:ribosome-associated protein